MDYFFLFFIISSCRFDIVDIGYGFLEVENGYHRSTSKFQTKVKEKTTNVSGDIDQALLGRRIGKTNFRLRGI